jgi:predicted RNase H-like nuclease
MMFVGADGCRSGWFTVILSDKGTVQFEVFPTIDQLWQSCKEAQIILLDIPIGLPDANIPTRQCDREARHKLRPGRTSSVFPAPSRAAVYCDGEYPQANALNRSATGRGISKQAWYIIPKIREVDTLLQNDELARQIIAETHPEVIFWSLANAPMRHYKKLLDGHRERLGWLKSIYPPSENVILSARKQFKVKEAATDDLVDALAVALTARNGFQALTSIPQPPEMDSAGLPMQILYYPNV